MDSTNQEQCSTVVFPIDKSAYTWTLAVQTPVVQWLSARAKKKKKTLESLPTIGFLTVPYDPILGMFGHSNLIIWVLPIYLYIITFFLATIIQVLYSIKSGNTNLFGSLSPAVNMNDMPLAKEDQKATHALNILHSPKREGHTSS